MMHLYWYPVTEKRDVDLILPVDTFYHLIFASGNYQQKASKSP